MKKNLIDFDEILKKSDSSRNKLFDALRALGMYAVKHKKETDYIIDITLEADSEEQKNKIKQRLTNLSADEGIAYARGYNDAAEYFLKIVHDQMDELMEHRRSTSRKTEYTKSEIKLRGKPKQIFENSKNEFKRVYTSSSLRKTADHYKISTDAVINIASKIGLPQKTDRNQK